MKMLPTAAILLVLLCCAISDTATAQDNNKLFVMSYNIRFDNPGDGVNSWQNRKERVSDFLANQSPDVLGVQEALETQVADILNALPGHGWVGVGRNDSTTTGEYSPIFYDSTRFEKQAEGTFWLSESGKIGSIGWDAAITRICSYAKLMDRTSQRTLWVFNAHFDHVGSTARHESAKLIVRKVREMTGPEAFVILTGDFNAQGHEPPIETLTEYFTDGRKTSSSPATGTLGTYNAFSPEHPLDNRKDYILTRNFKVLEYAHMEDKPVDGQFLSDHLAVKAILDWNE